MQSGVKCEARATPEGSNVNMFDPSGVVPEHLKPPDCIRGYSRLTTPWSLFVKDVGKLHLSADRDFRYKISDIRFKIEWQIFEVRMPICCQNQTVDAKVRAFKI
jgi:hypothetical protein